MWRTELGNRVLTGIEAKLFRAGVESLVFWLDMGEDHTVGVKVFDSLSVPERLAVLEQVTRALLVKRIACPVHTAVNEGAIAAVYYQMLGDIEVEIDDGQQEMRTLVRKACEEYEVMDVPSPRSSNMDKWRDVIDTLMFRILWDVDWQESFVKPDDPPEMAQFIRERMRVDAEYHTAVPPDPNPAQLAKIKSSLRRLCR